MDPQKYEKVTISKSSGMIWLFLHLTVYCSSSNILYDCFFTDVEPLLHYCVIHEVLLLYRCIITVLSLCNHCRSIVMSLFYYSKIIAIITDGWSPQHFRIISEVWLYCHCLITVMFQFHYCNQQLYNHDATTLQHFFITE